MRPLAGVGPDPPEDETREYESATELACFRGIDHASNREGQRWKEKR